MADDAMDLKIVRTGRIWRGVPLDKLRKWVAERRVTSDDLVRPVGAENWMKVSLAPELAPSPAAATVPPVPAQKSPPRPTPPAIPQSTAADGGGSDLGVAAPAKSRPRRRLRMLEETVMDMTPMIDVTFQMLIFFMFTNQLANPNPIEVPTARFGRGVTPDGKQAVLIDDQGRLYLGEGTKEENISPSLDALVREVADNAALADGPLEVIVSAHKGSHHVYMRELVDELGKIENIGPIRIGVEEQQ